MTRDDNKCLVGDTSGLRTDWRADAPSVCCGAFTGSYGVLHAFMSTRFCFYHFPYPTPGDVPVSRPPVPVVS